MQTYSGGLDAGQNEPTLMSPAFGLFSRLRIDANRLIQECRKLRGGSQTADCGRECTRGNRGNTYGGIAAEGAVFRAGKCTVDNGFVECEIAEFAGSTSKLAA